MTGIGVSAKVGKIVSKKAADFLHPSRDLGVIISGFLVTDPTEARKNEQLLQDVAGKRVGADEAEVCPQSAAEGGEDGKAGRGQQQFNHPAGQLVAAQVPEPKKQGYLY